MGTGILMVEPNRGQSHSRCGAGKQRYASDKALRDALQSCESELNQWVHPPLTMESSQASSQLETMRLAPEASTAGPQRYASIAIREKFTADGFNAGLPFPGASNDSSSMSRSYKASRSTAEFTLVMRATRETTDFVVSVLVWALKRDPSSHPAATAWQRNLEVFRGDSGLWSSSFRRLQERLCKELSGIFRDERPVRRQFAFEELKLVDACIADLRVEIEELAARDILEEEPSMQLLESLEQQLVELLDTIQVIFLINNDVLS